MATDNKDKQHDEEAANKAASRKMERNQEQQDNLYREAVDRGEDESSLANDTDRAAGALPLKEQNRDRLRDDKNEDFGGE